MVIRNHKVGFFSLEDQHARFNEILGAEIGRPAKLTAIDKNTKLVISGQHLLQEGDRVND